MTLNARNGISVAKVWYTPYPRTSQTKNEKHRLANLVGVIPSLDPRRRLAEQRVGDAQRSKWNVDGQGVAQTIPTHLPDEN